MTISKRILLTVTVITSCVSCDQVTKSVAETYLADSHIWSFWGDSVRLQLAHNTGAFLSLGAELPEIWRGAIFSIATGLMLVALLAYTLFAKSLCAVELAGLTLLLAGGAGNLIDRVLYGYVVDFMNIGIGSLRTGIFNVADIAVSAGAIILLVKSVKPEKS